jgi:hypothetical protein
LAQNAVDSVIQFGSTLLSLIERKESSAVPGAATAAGVESGEKWRWIFSPSANDEDRREEQGSAAGDASKARASMAV